jgi:ribosomal protein S16
MGTWGTGISSNDIYEDINYEFFELYNQGIKVSEITKKLISENQKLIESQEDQNNFWITIAKSQWECKALDQEIYNKIKGIVNSGKDIELWKELDGDKSDLTKRKKVLDNFLTKISTEKKNARKIKKKTFRDAIFKKGDCLVFKLTDGNYCGAFVLESEKNTEFGLNLIAITDIKKTEKPNLKDFENAKVHFSLEQQILVKNQEITTDFAPVEQIGWYHAQFYKKLETEFIVIGQLKTDKTYNSNQDFQRFSNWDNIVDHLDYYYNKNETCETNLKLKKLRKKYWL